MCICSRVGCISVQRIISSRPNMQLIISLRPWVPSLYGSLAVVAPVVALPHGA